SARKLWLPAGRATRLLNQRAEAHHIETGPKIMSDQSRRERKLLRTVQAPGIAGARARQRRRGQSMAHTAVLHKAVRFAHAFRAHARSTAAWILPAFF